MEAARRTIRVSDEVWSRWRVAAGERRVSVAQLVHAGVELLLASAERDLVGRAVARVGGERVIEEAELRSVTVDGEPALKVKRELPRRRLARTERCEHRVPATSFCKACDG